ncbi:hypothetical protein RRSWK_02770 [Rhodopirellula sp. SWK7]|nr:hypothetical protein RRSWK_02770 [Rhodopirellula sp. SWK7]
MNVHHNVSLAAIRDESRDGRWNVAAAAVGGDGPIRVRLALTLASENS